MGLLKTERAVIYSRLVKGRFPNYRQVAVALGRVTLVDFTQPVTETVPAPSKQKSSP